MSTQRRERLLWLVVRADAAASGAMVAAALVAVPVLALFDLPPAVPVVVGLVVIAAAVVLGALGAATAAILGASAGEVGLPADLAGLAWPGSPPARRGTGRGGRG